MFINFINEGLTKKIICDKPGFDNNDVTNLISLDPSKRSKGFLVANFVKPPVLINIEFICSIIITQITINCQVGLQKSSSIEVFTKKTGEADKIIVAKKCFSENEKLVNFVLHGSQKKISNSKTFRLSKYMCNVDEISIRILRTQGSTVAALGKVEVWGKPSRNVDKEIIKEINSIWTRINSFHIKKEECVAKPPKKTVFRYCRERKIPEVNIPEEFIDPITCEIFIIPMTLPSGKVVDASTIERFNKAEEKFGRPPSDPFTGRIYTDVSHPVIATSLKARLDKFLLDYSHIPSLKNVPRTVGRAPSILHLETNGITQAQDNTSSTSSRQIIKTVDDLLESCLNGLPSFLEKPSTSTTKPECFNCNAMTLLFKLKCKDLLCRSCLVLFKKDNISSCLKCKQFIDFKNAERFHSV